MRLSKVLVLALMTVAIATLPATAALPAVIEDASPATPVCVASGSSNTCKATESAAGRCGWWQMYEIDAEGSGNGTATARVACGGDAVTCDIDLSAGEVECHAAFAEGPGDLVCEVTQPAGAKVAGSCKDPANPAAVYQAVVIVLDENGVPIGR